MKLGPTVHCPERPAPWDEKGCSCLEKLRTRRSRGEGTEHTKCDVAKDRLSSAPFVSMVQASRLRNGNDTTVLRSVYGSRLRGVLRQG